MSDRESRQLERSLRAEGRLDDVVWEILDRTDDPKLIALVVDKFSSKLTVPEGNLLTLRPEESPMVELGETRNFPIMVPAFEGWRGKIVCFRVMLVSNGALSWSCNPRMIGRGLSARQWEGGKYTIPMAGDPFELDQASVWDLRIENQASHMLDVDFSLICRHQWTPCPRCEGYQTIELDGTPRTDPGSLGMPCPDCLPALHEQYRLRERLAGVEAVKESRRRIRERLI